MPKILRSWYSTMSHTQRHVQSTTSHVELEVANCVSCHPGVARDAAAAISVVRSISSCAALWKELHSCLPHVYFRHYVDWCEAVRGMFGGTRPPNEVSNGVWRPSGHWLGQPNGFGIYHFEIVKFVRLECCFSQRLSEIKLYFGLCSSLVGWSPTKGNLGRTEFRILT